MSQPNDLTVGPDGNLWFTDQGDPRAIGRVKPDGTINEFVGPLDPLNNFPNELTAGADGDVWFTDDGTPGAIGRVKPDGTIEEFTMGMPMGAQPDSLTLGPDGNVWFADQLSGHRAMGRVTPAGAIHEFSKGLAPMSVQDDITVAADGNLWIEQSMPGGVARITTAGKITQFKSGLHPGAGNEKDQLVPGPDGNLWFTDDGMTPAIGKVSLQIRPTASTGSASTIKRTTATVSGSVNPRGAATKVTFRFGTTRALASKTKSKTLPAGGDPAHVRATLSGLPAGRRIYYRVVASNAFGKVSGAVRSFRTHARRS
jgi:streptogramin lyase